MDRLSYPAALLIALAAACAGDIGGGSQPSEFGVDAATSVADASIRDATMFNLDAPPADAPMLACDAGDVRAQGAGGACYWAVHSTPLNRPAARAACQGDGGDLAIITSAAESDEVNAVAIAAMTASAGAVVDYWIGATDATSEGAFLWPDATPLSFVNWRAGEPNDGGVNGEDCTIVEADVGGSWDDRHCVDPTFGYLCER